MPLTDRREIEFDAEALATVAASSLRAAGFLGLRNAPLDDVGFHPDEQGIDFFYGKDRYREAIRLNAKAIGALLITYCILAKIPTPKSADKSIRVEPKSVILTFRLHFPKAPRLASVPSSAQSWD